MKMEIKKFKQIKENSQDQKIWIVNIIPPKNSNESEIFNTPCTDETSAKNYIINSINEDIIESDDYNFFNFSRYKNNMMEYKGRLQFIDYDSAYKWAKDNKYDCWTYEISEEPLQYNIELDEHIQPYTTAKKYNIGI